MQPRSRTVKEGLTDQEREYFWEKEKFWPAEEKRNKGGINLGKGNIWSTEGVNILPIGKIVVGGAGGTTHI